VFNHTSRSEVLQPGVLAAVAARAAGEAVAISVASVTNAVPMTLAAAPSRRLEGKAGECITEPLIWR
jgi:hypothetical protein